MIFIAVRNRKIFCYTIRWAKKARARKKKRNIYKSINFILILWILDVYCVHMYVWVIYGEHVVACNSLERKENGSVASQTTRGRIVKLWARLTKRKWRLVDSGHPWMRICFVWLLNTLYCTLINTTIYVCIYF